MGHMETLTRARRLSAVRTHGLGVSVCDAVVATVAATLEDQGALAAEADPAVFHVSFHRWPWPQYPWSGAPDERGEGAGTGATLNVEMHQGIVDSIPVHA